LPWEAKLAFQILQPRVEAGYLTRQALEAWMKEEMRVRGTP
jgi:hypothetical protein